MDQHRGRAAGRSRRRAAAPDRTGDPRPARDAHGFVAGRRARPRAGPPRRLRGRRHDHAPAQAGRLATQQADAAAAAIAAAAGAEVEPEAYRPVLRAMLLTGGRPRYLRHARGDHGIASDDAPWWPPHKIAGRELAPYLTAHPELLRLIADPRPHRRRRRRRARGGARAARPRRRPRRDRAPGPGRRLRRSGPSSVLSPFSGEPAPRVPLDRLGASRCHRGSLAAVDADAHTVRTTDGGELGYDRLIVAPGARAGRGRARRDDVPRPDQRRRRRGRAARRPRTRAVRAAAGHRLAAADLRARAARRARVPGRARDRGRHRPSRARSTSSARSPPTRWRGCSIAPGVEFIGDARATRGGRAARSSPRPAS